MQLFEDLSEGKINRDQYLEKKNEISVEAEALEKQISMLYQSVSDKNKPNKFDNASTTFDLLSRYGKTTEFSTEMLTLIKRVIIYSSEKIEVQFSFGEGLDVDKL